MDIRSGIWILGQDTFIKSKMSISVRKRQKREIVVSFMKHNKVTATLLILMNYKHQDQLSVNCVDVNVIINHVCYTSSIATNYSLN